MRTENIKLIAFDLDGTLSQHKSPLPPENRQVLEALSRKYALVMAGAGTCHRIFAQLERFPIHIIGNYGMQTALYEESTQDIRIVEDLYLPCDRKSVEERVTQLRLKYGYTQFQGNSIEFHASGCVTIPLLGTAASIADKLAFDPDRQIRRSFYEDVQTLFPDYTVFVGGSSSFDMAPMPYNKYYALDKYSRQLGLTHDQVAFVGDDYGPGGNDAAVYNSDFLFVTIDSYLQFPDVMKDFL